MATDRLALVRSDCFISQRCKSDLENMRNMKHFLRYKFPMNLSGGRQGIQMDEFIILFIKEGVYLWQMP